jgi:hypothetical protein
MRIYISGPMRGLPNHNFSAFDAAAARIRTAGWSPISPADLDREQGHSYDADSSAFVKRAMQRDMAAIFTCDQIAMLPGWRQSEGAVAEVALSCVIGMPALDGITLHEVTYEVREWWESVIGRNGATRFHRPGR